MIEEFSYMWDGMDRVVFYDKGTTTNICRRKTRGWEWKMKNEWLDTFVPHLYEEAYQEYQKEKRKEKLKRITNGKIK